MSERSDDNKMNRRKSFHDKLAAKNAQLESEEDNVESRNEDAGDRTVVQNPTDKSANITPDMSLFLPSINHNNALNNKFDSDPSMD